MDTITDTSFERIRKLDLHEWQLNDLRRNIYNHRLIQITKKESPRTKIIMEIGKGAYVSFIKFEHNNVYRIDTNNPNEEIGKFILDLKDKVIDHFGLKVRLLFI